MKSFCPLRSNLWTVDWGVCLNNVYARISDVPLNICSSVFRFSCAKVFSVAQTYFKIGAYILLSVSTNLDLPIHACTLIFKYIILYKGDSVDS